MNIALVGYGKMGKLIESVALANGHTVVLIVDKENALSSDLLRGITIDVAIEFSVPEAAYGNIKFCLNNRIPVISGTTGWLRKLPEIEALTLKNKGTFLYASNFSLGVNIFFDLNRHLSKLMVDQDYKISIEEIHHIHKKDAPSGTALSLADDIVKQHKPIDKWVNNETANPHELPIISLREGEVPGTHIVKYKGENDSIEIIHKATNRRGFAEGAVAVAEWISNRQGFFTMEDFLNH